MKWWGNLMLASALVASTSIALGQNGRPPPIKLGQPTPPPPPPPKSPPKTIRALPDLEEKKVIDALLLNPVKYTTFSWAAGIGDVQMEPTATHICLLTEVAGNFAGSEHVYLRINKNAPGGPRFVLGGANKQAQLKASATCAPKTAFTPGMFSVKNSGYVELPVGIDSGCGPTQYGGIIGDDAAIFVREMAGKYRGGNDGVDLGVSSNGSIGMRTSACSGWAGGAVGGVSFGGMGPDGNKGYGGVFKYYSKYGPTALTAAATVIDIEEQGGLFSSAPTPAVLAPVNKAFCGIVMIRGKFQSFNDSVSIKAVNGNWVGIAKTHYNTEDASYQGLVSGAFRCIARDQR